MRAFFRRKSSSYRFNRSQNKLLNLNKTFMCAFSLPNFVYARQVARRYIQEYRLDCAHKRVKYSILIVICKWNEISTNKNVQFSWKKLFCCNIYLSDVSDVFLQSIFKLIISESQFVTLVMFNIMIKKKVNWTVTLWRTLLLMHLQMIK